MSCCSSDSPAIPPREKHLEAASSCCGSGAGGRAVPDDIWLRLGISLVVAGQNMVWGLAYNLSRPEFGSQAYLIGHGWMILSTLLVVALLGPSLAVNASEMLRLRRLTVEGLFLLTATGALVASLLSTFSGEGAVYYEVVAVVLVIYMAGAFVGERARSRTREAVKRFEAQYDRAVRLDGYGVEIEMAVKDLEVGDRVLVKPAEPVPVDGSILEGEAFLQEAALTGEPHPRPVGPGMEVRAGGWSLDGRLVIEVEGSPTDREIDRLLRILDQAREQPSRLQRYADQITQWFLPFVAAVSGVTFAGWVLVVSWPQALFNSMAVLLVACPCALGLATPIAVWSGLWRLFHLGIISRSATLIDGLAETKRVFFDKTGTLSGADLEVLFFDINPKAGIEEGEIAKLVLAMEAGQKHPAARALATWAHSAGGSVTLPMQPQTLRVVPGSGVEAVFASKAGREGSRVARLGRAGWAGISDNAQHRVVLSQDGVFLAGFALRERFRADVAGIAASLESLGIAVEVLTGDLQPDTETFPDVTLRAGCSPGEKRRRVEESRQADEHPLFIGDGVNDTTAMNAAAASLAVDDGTDLAKSVSTGIIRGQNLMLLPEAIRVSRSVQKVLRQNLIFAAVYNLAGMTLAVAGILHPVMAALLMLLSSATVSARAAASARSEEPKPSDRVGYA